MQPSTATSSSPTSDVTKDNFIPIFTNKTEHYKEWRQRIQLYYKKMTLLNKKKEATINLLTSLTGIAWRQIEHVSKKLCDDEEGFGKAIAMLDACFQYDEQVEMPRALEKFFYEVGSDPSGLHLGAPRAIEGDWEVQHQVAFKCEQLAYA